MPIAAAAANPLLAWRGPVYILAGFAGIVGLGVMLFQPLLIGGYLPGLSGRIGRRTHLWIGGALVAAVVIHVAGLWITSPPDMIDALLFSSPTPFSPFGVIAMWAIFAVALLAALRRRLRPRTWRIAHTLLAIVIVAGTAVHAMLIEGAMETVSKAALCALVLAAAIKVMADLRVWRTRGAPLVEGAPRIKRLHRLLMTLLICFIATSGFASTACAYDVTPANDPEAIGFSSSRLARIAAWQQTQVDAGAFSGAVAAIARNGKVAYLRAVGFYDNAKTRPLQTDAIFWIASMSKPVTSVAAMMLVDDGKLDLAAPVHRYLPELRDMKVAVEVKDPATGRTDLAYEPQRRPMTVEDLLRHTAGLIHGVNGTTVDELWFKSLHDKDGVFHRDRTLADFVSALGTLPLAHQPGEVWQYGHSIDVLARVVEVASGQRFDQFLEARLLKPLGMIDTGFHVPEAKRSRLVDPPARGPSGPPDSVLADVTKPTKLFSGGGGLASTVADYLRFAQMLLNGGELDGVRILKPETVKRMTTNALPPGVRFAGPLKSSMGPLAGTSWGLGFMIRSDPERSIVPGSVGTFTWSGTWGTYFWVDPAAQLIALQFIQVPSNTGFPFGRPFRSLVYGALRVPDQGTPRPTPIDQAALASVEGTYRFASISSLDLQTEFGGVGVDIAIKDGLLRVTSPIRGTPADKAGVLSGDVITHLNGEPTQGMDLSQALEKIRGPAHTAIRLRIMRKGRDAPIELEIVRAPVRATGGADLQAAVKDGQLKIESTGALPVLDFEKGVPITVVPMSRDEFFVDGGDHTRLAFLHDEAGKVTGLVLNPGPWQITGQRADGSG